MDTEQYRRGNTGLVQISGQLRDCIRVYAQRMEQNIA